jgi:hypothetical protein
VPNDLELIDAARRRIWAASEQFGRPVETKLRQETWDSCLASDMNLDDQP